MASPLADSGVNPQNSWAPVAATGWVVSMQTTPAVLSAGMPSVSTAKANRWPVAWSM